MAYNPVWYHVEVTEKIDSPDTIDWSKIPEAKRGFVRSKMKTATTTTKEKWYGPQIIFLSSMFERQVKVMAPVDV